MSETHTSYEVSKRLKEFLGDSAPEPIPNEVGMVCLYDSDQPEEGILTGYNAKAESDYSAYQLHDLLSKSFCEAMAKALSKTPYFNTWVFGNISGAYWYGGLPAVEKVLMEMMEAK